LTLTPICGNVIYVGVKSMTKKWTDGKSKSWKQLYNIKYWQMREAGHDHHTAQQLAASYCDSVGV